MIDSCADGFAALAGADSVLQSLVVVSRLLR
jgi:hypothetical protein